MYLIRARLMVLQHENNDAGSKSLRPLSHMMHFNHRKSDRIVGNLRE